MAESESDNNHAEDESSSPRNKLRRLFIEFEDVTFLARDFMRFKRSQSTTTKYSSGVDFKLTLQMAVPPYEEVFSYPTEELRNEAYELLRMRLQDCGVIFETAKPIELKTVKEDTLNNESDEQQAYPRAD